MVDAHCHLQDFSEEEIKKLNDSGLVMICAGFSLESSRKAIEIANKYNNVYATVGVHPEENENFNEQKLSELTKDPKVVAVGECGLDIGSESEIELFRLNIGLAKNTRLPLVVHCRNMFEKVFDSLDYDRVQMHCFTGNKDEMEECVKRGWYISFGGILTFKNSHDLREVARVVPESRLLVETDSPYLAPEPLRGTRNSPVNVKYVLDCLEEVRGKSMEQITHDNASRLYERIR